MVKRFYDALENASGNRDDIGPTLATPRFAQQRQIAKEIRKVKRSRDCCVRECHRGTLFEEKQEERMATVRKAESKEGRYLKKGEKC